MKNFFNLTSTCLLLLLPVVSNAITYQYDSLNRLTEVVYSVGNSIAYNYDTAGNILSVTVADQNADSDGDGVINSLDAFPNDATEWADNDGDLIGDNADLDDDNDQIPDLFELANGLNPLDATDAQADNDLDKYTNLEEFLAGTDIASAASVPDTYKPIVYPDTGIFHSRVAVFIQGKANTTVYFTLDGSEPSTASSVYVTPFKLDQNTTIKTLAVTDDGKISPVTSSSYTLLNRAVWTPIPGLSWQWQLQDVFDDSVSARVYDLDLFDTPTDTITSLKATGHRVICYFNAGVWEDWRDDASAFSESLKGNQLSAFAGEKWLDIRKIDELKPIMQARLDLAATKGCDAVEPDNVDGYTNNTGFSLTADDQIHYNLWLSNMANARGLSIGLKNDLGQIPTLHPYFDWALNEQCLEFNECNALQPFITANKAVFGVEYLTAEHTPDTTSVCAVSDANKYSWIIKNPELDSWVDSCADYRDFVDIDNDGVVDYEDNCLNAENLVQRDTDNDGFGNMCDADLNNDGVTNFADFATFRQQFFTSNPDADLNGDGVVNFADFALFRSLFFQQPGPAAGY